MHSMKIKEVRTGSPSCRDSGGGIRAVKLTLCAALLAAAAGTQPAADWTITTFAGNGEYGGGFGSPAGDGGPAVDAQVSRAWGVEADGASNLFIADRANNRIRVLKTNPSQTGDQIYYFSHLAVGASWGSDSNGAKSHVKGRSWDRLASQDLSPSVSQGTIWRYVAVDGRLGYA